MGGCSLRFACKCIGTARSSLYRWKKREAQGAPLVLKPGPSKHKQASWPALVEEAQELNHCSRRTHGTIAFYEAHKEAFSRREISELIRSVRDEQKKTHNENLAELEWKRSGVVWAIDDTWCESSGVVTHIRDLRSGLAMGSAFASTPNASQVANLLRKAMREHGRPLVLKSDMGSNFHNAEVGEVLDQNGVLYLPSPPYTPEYNGALESHNRWLKEAVSKYRPGNFEELQTALYWSMATINHRPVRRLSGETPFDTYHDLTDRVTLSMRERRKIQIELHDTALYILKKVENPTNSIIKAIWRFVVSRWLEENDYLKIHRPKKVSPNNFELWSH